LWGGVASINLEEKYLSFEGQEKLRWQEEDVQISVPLTFSGTNTASATRANLGFSTNLNTFWTATNSSNARSAVGLGATWLTNTNVTNFRTAIGLGATNTAQFQRLEVLTGTNASVWVQDGGKIEGDGDLYITAGSLFFEVAPEFGGTNASLLQATTRTNLALGWPALTNTNAAIQLLGVNSTNAVVVADQVNSLKFIDSVTFQEDVYGIYFEASYGTNVVEIGGADGGIAFQGLAAARTRTNLFGHGGISTNIAVLRPGSVTNTLVFTNGILKEVQ
jgi:hypothetical protein